MSSRASALSLRTVACVRSQHYFDIKVIIAETEIFTYPPAGPGRPTGRFRRRLPRPCACQRCSSPPMTMCRPRVSTAGWSREMAPLYQRYDAFITAGQGEAPRLDAHRSLTFWQRPNLFTAANVTSQPALEICNGFGAYGLPLGMQMLGRPSTKRRCSASAMPTEQATGWHHQHPQLRAGRPGARPDATADFSGYRRPG